MATTQICFSDFVAMLKSATPAELDAVRQILKPAKVAKVAAVDIDGAPKKKRAYVRKAKPAAVAEAPAPAPVPVQVQAVCTIIGFMSVQNAYAYAEKNPVNDQQFYLLVHASRCGSFVVVARINASFNKYLISGLTEEISEYRLSESERKMFIESEKTESMLSYDFDSVRGCRGGLSFYEGFSKISANVYQTKFGS